MVAHTFNSSTLKQKQTNLFDLKAILVYIACSRLGIQPKMYLSETLFQKEKRYLVNNHEDKRQNSLVLKVSPFLSLSSTNGCHLYLCMNLALVQQREWHCTLAEGHNIFVRNDVCIFLKGCSCSSCFFFFFFNSKSKKSCRTNYFVNQILKGDENELPSSFCLP